MPSRWQHKQAVRPPEAADSLAVLHSGIVTALLHNRILLQLLRLLVAACACPAACLDRLCEAPPPRAAPCTWV